MQLQNEISADVQAQATLKENSTVICLKRCSQFKLKVKKLYYLYLLTVCFIRWCHKQEASIQQTLLRLYNVNDKMIFLQGEKVCGRARNPQFILICTMPYINMWCLPIWLVALGVNPSRAGSSQATFTLFSGEIFLTVGSVVLFEMLSNKGKGLGSLFPFSKADRSD